MLESARWIGTKIQEFMKRISDLEDDSKETKDDVKHITKDLELLRKEMQHDGKVREHLSLKVADLEQRVKKLESKNHSLATTAGIAKKKVEKFKEERKTRH